MQVCPTRELERILELGWGRTGWAAGYALAVEGLIFEVVGAAEVLVGGVCACWAVVPVGDDEAPAAACVGISGVEDIDALSGLWRGRDFERHCGEKEEMGEHGCSDWIERDT